MLPTGMIMPIKHTFITGAVGAKVVGDVGDVWPPLIGGAVQVPIGAAVPSKHKMSCGVGAIGEVGIGVAVLVSVVVGDGVVGVGVGAVKVVKFFVEVKVVPAIDPFTVN